MRNASAEESPFQARPRVFISYARSDGETFAAALVERLTREHPDIHLWQDRVSMEGGIGWWKQITAALERVEIMIMIMTPAALSSEVARKEWRYARQLGVRICPVMGVSPEELGALKLPSWMSKMHFQDVHREWSAFIGFLYSAQKDIRVPFMAPDLRSSFVERQRELDLLRAALLGPDRAQIASKAAALQGPGGFGKTTLAIAVCHDDDVVEAFHDGILWATLGQTPNVQAELTKIYAALTGQRPAFVDVEDVAMHVADCLDEKNCLIVIDDVWDPTHVRPFLRGGDQCARLVTTRGLPICVELDAQRIVVNEMTPQQSAEVLSARLPIAGPEDPMLVSKLARRLGNWPLLLKLAASQLQERTARGASIREAIGYVNMALDHRGIEAFDRANRKERQDAIASTVGASMGVLSSEEQRCCRELAILPPNVPLPLSALGALWRLSAFEVEELVQRLDSVALIDFDLRTATVRLHDVLRTHFYEQLESPETLHATLVREGWTDHYHLPDRHGWRWLGWHLVHAGDAASLEQLLLDFDWLKAKLAATDPQALLDDFEYVATSAPLRPIRDALRLSSHGLSRDSQQLAAQLLGRLEPGQSEPVDRLLQRAAAAAERPWLRLSHRSLTGPGGALLAILKAHAGPVEAVALSPSGIVSASADGSVRLWDLATNRVVGSITGQSGPIHCLVVTPDGRQIITGGEDRGVCVWDAETGGLVRQLRGHNGAVLGVAVSSGGDRIASVSDAGQVCLAGPTGMQKHLFKVWAHQLRPIAFTPDDKALAFGAGDGTAMLIDAESGAHLRTFRGHDGNVRALAFTPDGRQLLTGSDDAILRLWDVASGQLQGSFTGHVAGIDAVAVTPDGRHALSGSKDQTLRLWDLEAGALRKTLEGHSGSVRAVLITASGKHAVSASVDRTLRHWQLDAPPQAATGEVRIGAVQLLSASADGARAVSSSRVTSAITAWDARQARNRLTISAAVGDPTVKKRRGELMSHFRNDLVWLRMTADGERLLGGFSNRLVRTWDFSSGQLLHESRSHFDGPSMALSRDFQRGAALLRDHSVRFFDLASGRVFRILVPPDHERAKDSPGTPTPLPTSDVPAVVDIAPALGREAKIALSAEDRHVVLGFYASIVCWELDTGRARLEDIGDFDVVALTIDRQERVAVAGSRFGALRVIDIATAQTTQIFEGHQGAIFDVVISPDGKRLLSAGADDTLRVWELASGRELHRFAVGSGSVEEVVISRDGRFAFSIYGDTVVASRADPPSRLGSLSLDHGISAISVTADGRRLALGDESGHIHFATLEDRDAAQGSP